MLKNQVIEHNGDYYAVPEDFTGPLFVKPERDEDMTDEEYEHLDDEMHDDVIDLGTWDQNEAERKLALMLSDSEYRSPPDVSRYDNQVFEWGTRQFLVVTDEEADERWDKALDNYLEASVLDELPHNLRYYFDTEKWKSDARLDGRAHSLASYDGNEDYVEVNGTIYYIYRT